MTVDRALRGLAGFFVVLSVALGYAVHPAFYLFTVFVGVNLLQSAFSNWCPAMWIFRKLGLPDADGVSATGSCCAPGSPITH